MSNKFILLCNGFEAIEVRGKAGDERARAV